MMKHNRLLQKFLGHLRHLEDVWLIVGVFALGLLPQSLLAANPTVHYAQAQQAVPNSAGVQMTAIIGYQEGYQWSIDWGDGSQSEGETQNPFNQLHTYAAPGTYRVCLNVCTGPLCHQHCQDDVIAGSEGAPAGFPAPPVISPPGDDEPPAIPPLPSPGEIKMTQHTLGCNGFFNSQSIIIEQPEAFFMKLHISGLNVSPGTQLVVSNQSGESYVYPEVEGATAGKTTFWATSVGGDTAIVELRPTFPFFPCQGSVTINKYLHGFPVDFAADNDSPPDPNATTRSIIGSEDPDYEHVECYEDSHPVEYARSRAVALLVTTTGMCTAWRIGPEDHMMTNSHCFADDEGKLDLSLVEGSEVWFRYQCKGCNSWSSRKEIKVDVTEVVTHSDALDFALIRIDDTLKVSNFGYLSVDPSPPQLGEEIYIPQHPGGFRKRLAIKSDQNDGNLCRIDQEIIDASDTLGYDFTPNADTGYFCDMIKGSSGSPVISRSSDKVIALNHVQRSYINQGVRMELIWPLIENHVPNPPLTTQNQNSDVWFGGSDYSRRIMAGDADNDGNTDDVVHYGRCGNGHPCWRVHTSDGTSISTAKDFGGDMWFGGSDPVRAPMMGDLDNDGFIDDIVYNGLCGGDAHACWRVHIGSGTSFSNGNDFGGDMWFGGDSPAKEPMIGDIDNDGFIDDVVYFGLCGGTAQKCWRVHLGNGSSLSDGINYGGSMWFGGGGPIRRPMIGDLDNDGFVDDIAYFGRCGNNEPCWRVHIGDGSSFKQFDFGDDNWFPSNETPQTPMMGDFDGDGFSDDLIYYGRCDTGYVCWRAHFGEVTHFKSGKSLGADMWFIDDRAIDTPVAIDINNNGKSDILYYGRCGTSGDGCWKAHVQ